MFGLPKISPRAAANRNIFLIAAIAVASYITANILLAQLWVSNNYFLHSFIELFGLFLMFFSFIHTISTYYENDRFVQLVGFCALIVVILNLPHIVSFANLVNIPDYMDSYAIDTSLKYGVLVPFFELFFWLLIAFYRKGCGVSLRRGLILSISASVLCMMISVNIVDNLPSYYANRVITLNKHNGDILLVFAAIYIAIIYWKKCRSIAEEREKAMNKSIALAMSVFLLSRICFVLSDGVTSPEHFMGHMLKLAYYGFIYLGVYKTTIEYPYKRVRKVKDFYENLLDTSPFGTITFNLDRAVSFVSKQCGNLFGIDIRSLKGASIEKFIQGIEVCGYSKSELLDRLNNLRGGMICFYGQPTFSHEANKKLIFSVMESEMGFVFEIRDAKKAQAIENMQLQTQTLLDSTDNIVFLLDTNRKIVMCNRKFISITGLELSDVLGFELMELSRLLHSNLKDCSHIKVGNKKMMKNVVWCIRTIYGEDKKISLDSSPLYDVDNDEIGWIILGRDVSDYEKEQEKIIHREKMAIIGQMAAGLVHEIKNPLASIKGLCQLMRSRAKPEKVFDYSLVMESAVDDISEIVSGFLHFSKPAAGGFEEARVNDLVSSLETLISTNAYKNGIKTQFYYCETEASVLINEQQIKNIVLGIVDNAVEAMADAIDPRLLISTHYDKIMNEMHIAIKDNGMGMTEEQLACIGTPFYTTKTKGTGLGISMSKYVVELHGGELKIESILGEGALFTVSLPCLM